MAENGIKVSFSDGLALVGIILAIVLLVLDKAEKLKPGPTLFILLALAFVMTLPLAIGNSWVADVSSGTARTTRALLMICACGTFFSGFAAWIANPENRSTGVAGESNSASSGLAVDDILKPVYQLYGAKLGKPREPAESTQNLQGVYQAWHERAIVLYFCKRRQFFILSTVGEHKWNTQPDLGWIEDPEKWADIKSRSRMFPKIPKGLNPPFGGIAVGFKKDRNNWTKIGWMVDHCIISPPTAARVQIFEHGYILSGYRRTHHNGTEEIYVLVDGEPWISEGSPDRALDCIVPETAPRDDRKC